MGTRQRNAIRPPRQRRKLTRGKLLLFRLLAVLLPIFGLEAAARVYWVQVVAPPASDDGLYEEILGAKVLGDEVPYQFHPHRAFMVAATPTATNNLALRGDYDVDLAQPYDGIRILCIGDSVTFGYTVSGNQAAYPAVLEELLRREGIECQVLNAGMPRFRIQHLATMFQDHFRHYAADRVVILGGWNNANDRVLKPSGRRSWMSHLNEHWYTLRVVRRLGVLPEWGSREHVPAVIDPSGYADYGRSLHDLIDRVRAAGAEPVLCTLPNFFHHVDGPDARTKAATFSPVGTLEQLADVADTMNQQIRRVADTAGVPLLELSDIADHRQFADAIHPNDAGSRAVAEQVAAFFLAERSANSAN